jgi:SAM-dependent methyltransferase
MKTRDNSVDERDPSSFRDDRGFVFWRGETVYRRISQTGAAAYARLMESGLYAKLTADKLLVQHQEVEAGLIQPDLVPLISYPYEWSFSQLQDAALLTLKIQQIALEHAMTLRDGSAYNVQFVDGAPIFIDTLSFEDYVSGQPWQAYRQFCQHFLAPLALMSHIDLSLGQLLRVHIDGVPLQLAAKLLPLKHRINFGLLTHLVVHARFQHGHEGEAKKPSGSLSLQAQLGLIDSLRRSVAGLHVPKIQTQWGDYYEHTNYSGDSFKAKKTIVKEIITTLRPKRVLDLGANDGSFSRIAAATGAFVISCDIDPLAVERNYLQLKASGETTILPLLIDLTNPSPGLGWNNTERSSFSERADSDVALALALIHHLVIAANIPLGHVANYFAQLAPTLIIEFVPKTDSQVQRLLASREDIFVDYTQAGFEAAFRTYFEIKEAREIPGSHRFVYRMERR